MRALFLTLVLANAAFFGWARWVDVRPVAGSVSDFEGAAAAPRLTLVHAPAMDRSAQPPRRDPPRAGTGSDESLVDSQEIGRRDASCSSIGPF
ncbi:MAG TPA: hypothetical protein VLT59_17365, partial [Steroidobacteraceae bacterium]|nr:hypothetical protein [Steroidobacteraceae bacterium]